MNSLPPNQLLWENNGLLAIGELLIDAITAELVRDLSEAKTLSIHPGGSPANLCRFVQSCGGKATLVAAVGKDGLGKTLLESVIAAGISTAYIQQLEEHATSIIVVARSQGTPDFIAYRDADRYLQPVDEALIAQALVVHTTAFALSKAPAQQTILDAFQTAHTKGIPVSVDWNYAKPLWGNNNQAATIFNRILAYQPLLKVSLDDVARFTENTLSIEAAKEYLEPMSARVICLTCGSQGVWYKSINSQWQHMPAQPVEVKDATGAGDAFWAGFLTYWMQQKMLDSCVQQGITTAAQRLAGKL